MFKRIPNRKSEKPAALWMLAFWTGLYRWILKVESVLYLPFLDRVYKGKRYPSMAKRFVATFIDLIIVVVLIVGLISVLALKWLGISPEAHVITGGLIIAFLPPLLTVITTLRYKGTIGKRILGLRVTTTRKSAERIWGNLMLRELTKWLFILVWPFLFFLSMFSPRNRSIHDLIASTLVVIDKREG